MSNNSIYLVLNIATKNAKSINELQTSLNEVSNQ